MCYFASDLQESSSESDSEDRSDSEDGNERQPLAHAPANVAAAAVPEGTGKLRRNAARASRPPPRQGQPRERCRAVMQGPRP
jgi:hypothetical protein